jgi:hypothetical protein
LPAHRSTAVSPGPAGVRERLRPLAESLGRLPLELRILAVLVPTHFVLLGLNGINTFTFHTNMLILEEDHNLPNWFAVLQFAFASALCALAAGAGRGKPVMWALLAVAAAAFSFEDMVGIHNEVEERSGNESAMIELVTPALTMVLLALAAYASRGVPRLTRALIVGAGVALVASQLLGAANSAFDLSYDAHVLASMAEEMCEFMVGALLLAAAAPLALVTLGRLSRGYAPPA